ncbi:ATG18A [Symbiodinium sp. KB8]|nr:ATG18A [Symbiodinium sp. KB8]
MRTPSAGCFACGTRSGFRIYSCNPFKETFQRDFTHGGIGRVEMLFRCNILALVGGGESPRYPKEKVMIWDDHQNRCIGELSFRSEVRGVRLRRDRIVVVLQRKLYVYNFADLARVHAIETADNPTGLCALSAAPSHNVLACPAMQRGKVRVELYDRHETVFVNAHESDIACLQLNHTGSRLATASGKGTLVRIFNTADGSLLQELRRGTDHTTIWSIAFSPGATMLALTSEKGTCHVFKLAPQVHDSRDAAVVSGAAGDATGGAGGDARAATRSDSADDEAAAGLTSGHAAAGSGAGGSEAAGAAARGGPAGAGGAAPGGSTGVGAAASAGASSGTGADGAGRAGAEAGAAPGSSGGIGGMFTSVLPRFMVDDRSYAQFRTEAKKSICAFGAERNTVIVVTEKGSYLKASFDRGGEAERLAYAPFVKSARS